MKAYIGHLFDKMSLQQTPVIADSETMETLKLAEEISTFFEDQKLKAQDRIRQCEAFINNLHLPSKSVKEGNISDMSGRGCYIRPLLADQPALQIV